MSSEYPRQFEQSGLASERDILAEIIRLTSHTPEPANSFEQVASCPTQDDQIAVNDDLMPAVVSETVAYEDQTVNNAQEVESNGPIEVQSAVTDVAADEEVAVTRPQIPRPRVVKPDPFEGMSEEEAAVARRVQRTYYSGIADDKPAPTASTENVAEGRYQPRVRAQRRELGRREGGLRRRFYIGAAAVSLLSAALSPVYYSSGYASERTGIEDPTGFTEVLLNWQELHQDPVNKYEEMSLVEKAGFLITRGGE